MASFLSSVPFAAPEVMPWDWNPAATFQTAFNNAREERRAQQEFEMKAQLDRILFPQKQAEVEFNLKKLAYDTELLTDAYKTKTAELEERRRIIRTGRSGLYSNAAGSGVGGTGQQDDQQQLGYSNRLRKTSGVGTLGSGLQPIKPLGGN